MATRPSPIIVVTGVVAAVIAASTAYHVALAVGLTEYSARGAPPPGDGLVLAGLLAV
jgi:hypothetical protein